jgi:hypothetical protein
MLICSTVSGVAARLLEAGLTSVRSANKTLTMVKRKPQISICRKCRSVRVLVLGPLSRLSTRNQGPRRRLRRRRQRYEPASRRTEREQAGQLCLTK